MLLKAKLTKLYRNLKIRDIQSHIVRFLKAIKV